VSGNSKPLHPRISSAIPSGGEPSIRGAGIRVIIRVIHVPTAIHWTPEAPVFA